MIVPSWQFLVFILVGAAVFNAVPMRWREGVWLVLNLAFVCTFPGTLLPLAAFLALGYVSLTASHRGWFWGSIIVVLAAFIWMKRYSFIPEALLPPVGAVVGLSYVFFRVMHLVIDADQPISPLRYLNFTLNFPAFVSGPIQRREDYEAAGTQPLGIADLGIAAWRMVLGAFKILILSASLHTWQVQALAEPGIPAGAMAVVLYPLFLYANFSGYTDFVIGAARLFRLRLPENFDRPFAAVNFIEFWGRWHISLSQWLRSYVFNPLLMTWMRRDKAARSKSYPAVVAFFVTFFLVGAWHGPTSEFLFFGLLQGSGVAGNRLYQVAMTRRMSPAGYQRLGANPLYRALARGLTFTWFAFTLLWFWASWAQISALASALGVAGVALASIGTTLAASLVLAVPDLFGEGTVRVLQSRYTRTAFSSAMVLAMAIAILVLNLSSPEIVYKQF